VSYRGYNAADWEFTNMYQGQLTHVLDQGFIVTPGRLACAIELYGPRRRGGPGHHAVCYTMAITTGHPMTAQPNAPRIINDLHLVACAVSQLR